MELIPIAIQLVSALASSGVAGTIVSGLAGMLGGSKAKDAAKTIVDTATRTFGTSDPEQIKLLIAQDATKAEEFAKALDADTERYRIQVEDTKDARARDITVRAQDGTNRRANVMLVGAYVMLAIILLGTIYFRQSIPTEIAAILNLACGSLLTLIGQAFNFEFGSSRSSSSKTEQISELIASKK